MVSLNVNPVVYRNNIAPPSQFVSDQFGVIFGHIGLVASEYGYEKDEEIFGEGEPAEYVYQVITGGVRSYKLLSDGRRQIGAFFLPGEVFGLESSSVHRSAAETVVDTTVRLVKRSNLEELASVSVEVAHSLWVMTASELKHAENHMLLLGRKSAMERVANFLLEMDARLAIAGVMALPMCRRDIGDYLGLTLETVSRALSQLETNGVLGFSGARQIALRNRQYLQRIDGLKR